MKRSSIGVLTAVLCCAVTLPAMAAWDRIGEVRVGGRHDRDTQPVRLGGPVEGLRLEADHNNVMCRSVVARFGNGRDRIVFQGELRPGQPRMVDLPGDRRNIRSLAFDCGVRGPRDAVIHVSADVGRYRSDWQRNPDFGRVWSRMFNWGSNMANDWRYLESVSFEGRRDRENSFAGWRGQDVDAVALKPLDADARCSRVTARFGNGRTQTLNVNNGDYLRRGQFYKLDLPGRVRDLRSLNMRCRASDARRVTIQIFTSKG
ncbi:MAG: hypothetical protein BGN85_04230 [Alphaproteobacteria bacterium 64-11]|nr:hypothetical protein [Alphaproteobacteria bacterium]OJU09745.1 MAG: hypothetical protein BGN85_04230 [Alphaproteobacteria bacterium 64-11]